MRFNDNKSMIASAGVLAVFLLFVVFIFVNRCAEGRRVEAGTGEAVEVPAGSQKIEAVADTAEKTAGPAETAAGSVDHPVKGKKKSGAVKALARPQEEKEDTVQTSVKDDVDAMGLPLTGYEIVEGRVKKGEFLSTLLYNLGMDQKTAYNLTEKCKGVFDIRQLRVGNKYKAYYTEEDRILSYLLYEKDARSFVVFNTRKDDLSVRIEEKDIKTEMKYAEVTINTSLWQDVINAGASPNLAIKLSDIYAWTIDFFGLQKGDSFKTLYSELSYEGKILDVKDVLYASFVHGGTEYLCYYFEEDGTSNVYWNEKGESMRKAFLKAPLNFKRISSGFTYARRHPITRVVRPHTGVDYAAPSGTPVWSIGDGVVIQKGYAGGGGNTVKIRHNSVYQTAYLHLSRYGKGIKVGARVKQGQVIGYVGSTGMSTGPHLDFRVWKNGTPINPLKMDSPPATPVSKDHMDAFRAQIDAVNSIMNRGRAVSVLEEKFSILD